MDPGIFLTKCVNMNAVYIYILCTYIYIYVYIYIYSTCPCLGGVLPNEMRRAMQGLAQATPSQASQPHLGDARPWFVNIQPGVPKVPGTVPPIRLLFWDGSRHWVYRMNLLCTKKRAYGKSVKNCSLSLDRTISQSKTHFLESDVFQFKIVQATARSLYAGNWVSKETAQLKWFGLATCKRSKVECWLRDWTPTNIPWRSLMLDYL